MKKATSKKAQPVTALGHKIPKPRKVNALPKSAPSLKPNFQLSEACAASEPRAEDLAIRDAWRFNAPDHQGKRPHPVTQSTVRVESDPQVIFAPDQRTSVGVTRG